MTGGRIHTQDQRRGSARRVRPGCARPSANSLFIILKGGAVSVKRQDLVCWRQCHLPTRTLFTQSFLAPAPTPSLRKFQELPPKIPPHNRRLRYRCEKLVLPPLLVRKTQYPNLTPSQTPGGTCNPQVSKRPNVVFPDKRNRCTSREELARSTHIQRKGETCSRRGSFPEKVAITVLREHPQTAGRDLFPSGITVQGSTFLSTAHNVKVS